jgi:rhodanese-related sulfurtransferase
MANNRSPGFVAICTEAKKNVTEITREQMQAKKDNGETVVLVDVREDNEWEKGHIPDAIHIGKGVIERDIEKQIPDQATQVVLYCGGGSRSALAAENVQRMGYTNVASLIGGYRGWTGG